LTAVGVKSNEQVTAAWLTVTSTPAMVAVPVRPPPPLAAIRNVTSARPVPLGADSTAIQAACDTTVHVQKSSVEIVKRASPPLGPMLTVAGDTVTLHVAASCVISARRPLTTMPPRRGVVEGFGGTEYETEPVPCPLLPLVMLNHAASLVADH
jgi:hypothetical protein